MKELRVEYTPIDQIKSATRNPKKHDIELLEKSIGRFGVGDVAGIVDERTGKLVAGHGRIEALRKMEARGAEPPAGVANGGVGWKVPLLRGWASKSDQDAEAFLLAHNRTSEVGGWDDSGLLELLKVVGDLSGIGFDQESVATLEALLGEVSSENNWGNAKKSLVEYTSKVESPVYRPTGECPDVSSLCDTSRATELLEEIENADVPVEVKDFLTFASYRHAVFDYQSIAEFYAHAEPKVQRLMEKSALVIIDFKSAIENGFVKLAKGLAEDYAASP